MFILTIKCKYAKLNDRILNMADVATLENQEIKVRIPYHDPPKDLFDPADQLKSIAGDDGNKRYIYSYVSDHGGEARVHKGWDTRLGIPVAIKFKIDPEPKLLIKEAEIISKIDHPNIIKVLDLVPTKEENVWAYIMRYVDQPTLIDLIKKDNNKPNLTLASKVANGIGSAIDYMHKLDITHGDIKPENIFIRKNMDPILADFGGSSSKEFPQDERISVSQGYTAPEIIGKNEIPSIESDTYSLGVVLFKTITGHKPYESRGQNSADNSVMMAFRALTDNYRSEFLDNLPGPVSQKLKDFFSKALNNNKEERFKNGAELAKAFDQAIRYANVVI